MTPECSSGTCSNSNTTHKVHRTWWGRVSSSWGWTWSSPRWGGRRRSPPPPSWVPGLAAVGAPWGCWSTQHHMHQLSLTVVEHCSLGDVPIITTHCCGALLTGGRSNYYHSLSWSTAHWGMFQLLLLTDVEHCSLGEVPIITAHWCGALLTGGGSNYYCSLLWNTAHWRMFQLLLLTVVEHCSLVDVPIIITHCCATLLTGERCNYYRSLLWSTAHGWGGGGGGHSNCYCSLLCSTAHGWGGVGVGGGGDIPIIIAHCCTALLMDGEVGGMLQILSLTVVQHCSWGGGGGKGGRSFRLVSLTVILLGSTAHGGWGEAFPISITHYCSVVQHCSVGAVPVIIANCCAALFTGGCSNYYHSLLCSTAHWGMFQLLSLILRSTAHRGHSN